MINEENLNKMFDGIIKINGKELTTQELNSYGFNSRDLLNLIENGFLKKVKRGYYSFVPIDDLFRYGKRLNELREYDKATACFKKCYELNPNHIGACFRLFLQAIQLKDYPTAFNYFERLYKSDNKYYQNDNNFYLYLLSMITELPEQHKKFIKYIKLENVRVDFSDKRYGNVNYINKANKVIISSLNQRFYLAYKQLLELSQQSGNLSARDVVIKTLLSQAIETQKNVRNNIALGVVAKMYEEIVVYLLKIQNQHHLSEVDECILMLAKNISEIKETDIFPKPQIGATNNLFEAIKGKNYELALSLSKDYNKIYEVNDNNNILFMLLRDITELINSKKEILKESIQEKENMQIIESINNEKSTTNVTNKTSFIVIMEYLMKHDFDNSYNLLKKYLKEKNKNQYEVLINDLIQISLIEKDMIFTKPFIVLMEISRDRFYFNMSDYIQKFYDEYQKNNFVLANLYLDIMLKYDEFGNLQSTEKDTIKLEEIISENSSLKLLKKE